MKTLEGQLKADNLKLVLLLGVSMNLLVQNYYSDQLIVWFVMARIMRI